MYNGVDSGQNYKKTMAGSKEVLQTFMLDHNFTRPCIERPPAIGEEQGHGSADEHSNSSVSGRSEVSNATPRRADADLGYEPDGSSSSLPAHERWKLSLHNMLEDRDGVCLFTEFLKEIKKEKILECWLAMKGFQDFGLRVYKSASSSAASSTTGPINNDTFIQMDDDTITKRLRLAAKIYHDYLDNLRGDEHVRSVVKSATKVYIRQQIKSAKKNQQRLDRDLFLQAQNEIERFVECHSYKDFLNSKIFMQHASQYDGVTSRVTPASQAYHAQQTTNDVKSSSNVAIKPPLDSPSTGIANLRLSRIPEEGVWTPDATTQEKAGHERNQANRSSSNAGIKSISGSQGPQRNPAAYPYYVGNGYQNPAPSAVGSDQASKSSDTTDFTDNGSSVDGVAPAVPCGARKDRPFRSCGVLQKSDVLPPCPHNPRTKTCGKIPTMATDDPASFFELLKGKLNKYLEEMNMKRLVGSLHNEDSDQILESHLSRVAMDSPRGQHSPPNAGINTSTAAGRRGIRHFTTSSLQQQVPAALPTGGVAYGGGNFSIAIPPSSASLSNEGSFQQRFAPTISSSSHHLFEPNQMMSTRSKDLTSSVRNKQQRPSDVASINMGIVPGIPSNSVPDVPTPVIPVDKTRMISAWIQMPQDHQRGARKLMKELTVPSFVNPVSSTGLNMTNKPRYSNSSANPLRPQPAGLLAQDPTMPLLDQPDAGTTIEEVKRRLIEETEVHESAIMSEFVYKHMNIDSAKMVASASSTSAAANMVTSSSDDVSRSTDGTDDTDSSTHTAVCPSNKMVESTSSGTMITTTVVYKMPNEKYHYKVHLPYSPITLAQLKSYLASLHKGQKYRYFFRKHNNEDITLFDEYKNDGDVLPTYDGIVSAKLEYAN